ncbi:MAG TPA: hypothetical protein VLA24_04595 [Pseudomonadales bacterium]|nr:hypothetical protein [Pseudomonadales bacterium]
MKNVMAMSMAVLAWFAVDVLDAPVVKMSRGGICYQSQQPGYDELRYYRSYTTLASCLQASSPTIAGR